MKCCSMYWSQDSQLNVAWDIAHLILLRDWRQTMKGPAGAKEHAGGKSTRCGECCAARSSPSGVWCDIPCGGEVRRTENRSIRTRFAHVTSHPPIYGALVGILWWPPRASSPSLRARRSAPLDPFGDPRPLAPISPVDPGTPASSRPGLKIKNPDAVEVWHNAAITCLSI